MRVDMEKVRRYAEAKAYALATNLPAVEDFAAWCVKNDGVHLRDAAIAHLVRIWSANPRNGNVSREQLAAGAVWATESEVSA